jgi:NAD(P)-dependent dehydrogenase (short-subunit alcohol dehydrogenase family)
MSSPPPTNRLIIVLGSGPGIGVGVASHFAAQSFNRVALLSRNASRLQQDAASVVAAAKQAHGAVEVRTYPIDLTDGAKLEEVLRRVVRELGTPEVVVCNAARVAGGRFFEVREEDILGDFKVRLPMMMMGMLFPTGFSFSRSCSVCALLFLAL